MLPFFPFLTTFLFLPSSILAVPTTIFDNPDANPHEIMTDNLGQICQYTQDCLELTGAGTADNNPIIGGTTHTFPEAGNFLNLTGYIGSDTRIFVGYCACTFYADWDTINGKGNSTQGYLEFCHATNVTTFAKVPYYATCIPPDVNRKITSIKGKLNQAQPISNLI